eukprot:TRINITY_DN39085_c0_g1_i1.p1 TRINITY_DN39085_c0_g1~~TRINITY_DN39085_c0_g1_i1.p1  ORF type:complete len:354 (-),score=84.55 TRINITY_DN39085_c0_g1_i1:175-1236(-)
MIRRPPRSTLSSSSAASDVYKRQPHAPIAPSLPPPVGGFASIPTVSGSDVVIHGLKWWKLQWDQGGDSMHTVKVLLAGAGAGAIAKTCVAPLERIKMLCQVWGLEHPGQKTGILRVSRSVYSTSGVLGFWHGNFANVVRIVPNKGILFMCNDKYKEIAGVVPGQKPAPLKIMLAGSLSGITTTVLTYPLDLIRSRLMMSGGNYRGIADCARQTVAAEGLRGLYAGLAPTLAGIVPYTGINFTCYDTLKRYAQKEAPAQGIEVHTKLVIGAVSGMFSQTVSYPIDTVRRRMQLQGTTNSIYTGSFDCLAKVVRSEGVAALYRGLAANLIRAGPNTAIQFLAYEQLSSWLGSGGL